MGKKIEKKLIQSCIPFNLAAKMFLIDINARKKHFNHKARKKAMKLKKKEWKKRTQL